MNIIRHCVTLAFQCTPQSLRHFLRDRLSQEKVDKIKGLVLKKQVNEFQKQKNRARKLEDKLWGGFSTQALLDLHELRDDTEAKLHVRVYAAWALARWFACKEDYESALQHAVLVREWCTWKPFDLAQALLEVDCLVNLGRHEEARAVAGTALEYRPGNTQLVLALANTYISNDDNERLSIINKIYMQQGFDEISIRQQEKPLGMGNIAAATGKPVAVASRECPKVTIIMPVYKAEETLHIAVDSLLGQSWENLEILIVDDCSPDDTFSVAREYEKIDSRVKAFKQEVNQGSYSARNLALSKATGEFITTHDADDWSHPQKIETQISHLLANRNDFVANVTHWVRVFPNLLFRGTSRPTNHMIQWNHSSLMMSRELLLQLGGWDKVRITGDTELIWRLEHFTGKKLAKIYKDIPLSFALEDPSSLTRQSHSHVWSIHYGVRREYREMADFWHKHVSESQLQLDNNLCERPFPAPSFMQADKKNCVSTDVLLIMDCGRVGTRHVTNMEYVNHFLAQGKHVGLFHWPHYRADVTKPINNELRQLALEKKVSIFVSGENIVASEVVALNPLALVYVIDRPPSIESNNILIVADVETSQEFKSGYKISSHTVDDNLRTLFGLETKWGKAADIGIDSI
ncbi:glycosyltransferase family 2 protein [Chromohalobacter canadensis]|uniref:Glycosyltransferase n=1 Tax=Chromohalobacter canadensis TaxID=141389 RepID=A0ABZ0YBS6_9GAMM|nr:glycosyltransferase [Chromohalobacter canadensis]MCK0770250.1 glycosyltransferase [Chromohalobacter canadensis]WQH08927.1 glycosyltransferase [Chromohalobacter canadensis]